jgi:acetyltransferase-like isoleucine patch superfamily enzyme
MKFANITLGENVEIDPSTSFNNVSIGNNVKIAKRCSVYGSASNPLEIKSDSYIGMNTIIDGFARKVVIGSHVSIAPNVHIMSASGPNASQAMQRIFPIIDGEIVIDDHCWIGAGAVIMPGVTLGRHCVVAVNSFVNTSFPEFSIIGGSPAKLIRVLTVEEKKKLQHHG